MNHDDEAIRRGLLVFASTPTRRRYEDEPDLWDATRRSGGPWRSIFPSPASVGRGEEPSPMWIDEPPARFTRELLQRDGRPRLHLAGAAELPPLSVPRPELEVERVARTGEPVRITSQLEREWLWPAMGIVDAGEATLPPLFTVSDLDRMSASVAASEIRIVAMVVDRMETARKYFPVDDGRLGPAVLGIPVQADPRLPRGTVKLLDRRGAELACAVIAETGDAS